MKLETIQIDNTVRSGLNSFTDGVIIRDTKVLITLNLPDGQKTTIEGEWRHMSDANRLSVDWPHESPDSWYHLS